MYTFSGIKLVKIDVATSYLVLATFIGVQLYLQNCKSKSVLVVSIFETQGVMWVRPFTHIVTLYSKFMLSRRAIHMNTVKVFHEGGPVLLEENGLESKRESCSAAH